MPKIYIILNLYNIFKSKCEKIGDLNNNRRFEDFGKFEKLGDLKKMGNFGDNGKFSGFWRFFAKT